MHNKAHAPAYKVVIEAADSFHHSCVVVDYIKSKSAIDAFSEAQKTADLLNQRVDREDAFFVSQVTPIA